LSDRQQHQRPDTSKNGLLKRRHLQVQDESVKKRGRDVLSRLGKRRGNEGEGK
jgi:hypothetical protein